MKIIKKIREKLKMIKDQKEFRDTMYDYNNINEYYSYYGNVVYISSDYLAGNDYFLILKKENKYAMVYVTKNEIDKFNSFKNRDNLIEELKSLEDNIQFIEGLPNLIVKIGWYLLNIPFNIASRNELIKLKNSHESLWNLFLVENTILFSRKDKTVSAKFITNDVKALTDKLFMSMTIATNIYNTQFTLSFEWVAGNNFMDVTVYHFRSKNTRRIFLYDIKELSNLIKIISDGDEFYASECAIAFCSA